MGPTPSSIADSQRSPHSGDESLRKYAQYQETIGALSQAALDRRDIQSLLDDSIARIANSLEVDLVRVLQLQPDNEKLVVRAIHGKPVLKPGSEILGTSIHSQAGFALAAGEPVLMSDAAAEKRFAVLPALRDAGIVSGITVAIPGRHRPFGVLAAYGIQSRQFTSDEVRFFRSVANLLGVAIKESQSAQALGDSESRMSAIVNNAVDGILTIDEHGIVESMNLAAVKLFGYSTDEVIGRNISMLMPEPHRSQHNGYLLNYLRTGVAKIIGIGRETVGRRKDGTTFPMDLAVTEFKIAGRRMFAGSVRDISERRRLERQIIEAATEEQRRIGHDLHDGLCQQLAGIAFANEVQLQKLQARSAPEAATISKIGEMVDEAITQARQLARGLQPVTLEASGLASALKELAIKVEEVFRISCVFDCEHIVLVPDNVIATHLFRIAQESINNAIKHGKAHTIIIELAEEEGQVRLTIRDNGIGINESKGDGRGIGLQSMAYRARMIGGTFDLKPGPRGGTVVNCSVPVTIVTEKSVTERTQHASEESRESNQGEQFTKGPTSRSSTHSTTSKRSQQTARARRGRSSHRT